MRTLELYSIEELPAKTQLKIIEERLEEISEFTEMYITDVCVPAVNEFIALVMPAATWSFVVSRHVCAVSLMVPSLAKRMTSGEKAYACAAEMRRSHPDNMFTGKFVDFVDGYRNAESVIFACVVNEFIQLIARDTYEFCLSMSICPDFVRMYIAGEISPDWFNPKDLFGGREYLADGREYRE